MSRLTRFTCGHSIAYAVGDVTCWWLAGARYDGQQGLVPGVNAAGQLRGIGVH